MTAEDTKFNWSNQEVQLCKKCQGSGRVPAAVSLDVDETVICPWCEGSGRVLKTTTVKYEPYNPELNK